MSNLKELRSRVENVKNMQRITAAMRMVAASKLRHAQNQRVWARPYEKEMETVFNILDAHPENASTPFIKPVEGEKKTLFIVISSDRGLCGGFNASLMRHLRDDIAKAKHEKRNIFLIPAGKKIAILVRRYHHHLIMESYDEIAQPSPEYNLAEKIAETTFNAIQNHTVNECFIVYNRFISNLVQTVTRRPLVPVVPFAKFAPEQQQNNEESAMKEALEPNYQTILEWQIKKLITMRIYNALLESFQAEQASRMNAMDNASRNARDMISELTLTYNRLRQAAITKELVEIISGAEAV